MRDAVSESDMYEFSEDPQTAGDVVVANHYTSTHPESMFRRTLTIQAVRGNERILLRGEVVNRWVDGTPSETRITRARLAETARELFGIELPAGPFVYEQYVVGV
jgi:N-hydroxyarylamine O-acetyltransferase